MRLSLFLIICGVVALPNSFAQRPTAPPRPRPAIRDLNARQAAESERRLRELREMELQRKTGPNDKTNAGIPPIYRKTTKEETTSLEPPKDVQARYSEFLKKARTGIITLNANEHCGADDALVSAEQSCLGVQFPGGGTAYSFRVSDYRTPRLADLKLAKNILITDSVGQQGMLVDLGTLPIEDLDLKSAGMHFVAAFKPPVTNEEFRVTSHELEVGVNKDGFLYRLSLLAKADHSYALRSIAYDGQSTRSINGIVFDEFAFDKRDDIIVVFTIADVAQNGNVTIVWRELRREDPPKIKSSK
jgi:hypothetical protein